MMGDWNMPPQDLVASGWPLLVDGVVVAPSLPTCNGSVYDYCTRLDSDRRYNKERHE